MKIDPSTGAITLPSGLVLHSGLKMDAFRASDRIKVENISNPGTPWYYHSFVDGLFEELPLGFDVCFYESPTSHESVLTYCSIHTSPRFEPAEGRLSWEGHSLEGDVRELEVSRRLLESLLGRPHRWKKNQTNWELYPSLQNIALYDFPWGWVECGSEDHMASIVRSAIDIGYSANARWAGDDYQRYKDRLPKASAKTWWKR